MISEQEIAEKLGVSPDAVGHLVVIGAGDELEITDAALSVAARFRLDPVQPLGMQLAELGVLTEDEALWLDGVEGG